jgi:hypothetical protein
VEVYTTTGKKGAVKTDYTGYTGQPFSIMQRLSMARTFKLHNVAAFCRFYQDFPDKTPADLEEYVQVANESSHQCRYTTVTAFKGPPFPADGSTYMRLRASPRRRPARIGFTLCKSLRPATAGAKAALLVGIAAIAPPASMCRIPQHQRVSRCRPPTLRHVARAPKCVTITFQIMGTDHHLVSEPSP